MYTRNKSFRLWLGSRRSDIYISITYEIQMIFPCSESHFTAWLSHNTSWNISLIWPFFFFKWQIMKSQHLSSISFNIPPQKPGKLTGLVDPARPQSYPFNQMIIIPFIWLFGSIFVYFAMFEANNHFY